VQNIMEVILLREFTSYEFRCSTFLETRLLPVIWIEAFVSCHFAPLEQLAVVLTDDSCHHCSISESFGQSDSGLGQVQLTVDGVTRSQEAANVTLPKVVSRTKGKGWRVWREVVSRST